MRPIPLPHRTDLPSLDLPDLRKAAYHTHRLDRNWSAARPHVAGPIERVPFEEDAQVVSLVPGANIVVLFQSPDLVCYDSTAREKAAPLRVGERCFRISRAYFETPGQFLVTVAVGDDECVWSRASTVSFSLI